MVTVSQHCQRATCPWIVYFKMANFMPCEFDLNLKKPEPEFALNCVGRRVGSMVIQRSPRAGAWLPGRMLFPLFLSSRLIQAPCQLLWCPGSPWSPTHASAVMAVCLPQGSSAGALLTWLSSTLVVTCHSA